MGEQYAVIFDAGSCATRVHVFRFDQSLNIGHDFQSYKEVIPGLSDYGNYPNGVALSLLPLLKEAQNAVPQELHSATPIRLGATAGLRMLEGNASEQILEAVTINYLLGKLGGNYSDTVATVDFGGGSLQMAYAIPKQNAKNASKTSDEGDPYVQDFYLGGNNYCVYAHSYLNYGLRAARAENMASSKSSGNPCITTGYNGIYEYNGMVYEAKAGPFGANFKKCKKMATKLLKLNAKCKYDNCSFSGAWSGDGGAGLDKIYVISFFYDLAVGAGIIDSNAGPKTIRPVDYLNAAKLACSTTMEDMETTYPNLVEPGRPFLCMDLVYAYTLLVQGFGVHPLKKITTLRSIEYKNISVIATWPLGCAIDVVSSLNR